MISQAETATAPSLTKSPTILHQPLSSSPPPATKGEHELQQQQQQQQSISPASTTTKSKAHHNNSNHHDPSSKSNPPPSSPLHNTSSNNVKTQKSSSIKKRKRFEETIIDGFSIIAFKTWEDLQDELNERSSSLSTATAAVADSASGNSYDHNVVKKASSKSRHKTSSSSASSVSIKLEANPVTTNFNGTLATSTSVAASTTTSSSNNLHKQGSKKKKEKLKRSPSQSPELHTKDKRNKTSPDKTTLKKALEAKELAEKRLSILEKKLELEQSRNRSSHKDSNNHDQNQKTTSIVPDHYSSNRTSDHIRKDDMNNSSNVKCNSSIGHDQIREPISYLNAPKATSYSPFHINSHLQRAKVDIEQPTHTPPMHQAPAILNMNSSHLSQPRQHLPTSNLPQQPNQLHRSTPPLQSMIRDPYHPQTPPISSQASSYQQRPPPIHSQSQTAAHHMVPPQHHNLLHPYSSQPASSIMSSMGLGPLASPYSCPSICITDTISRQTSIIPPIGATLEQSTSQTSTRFGTHNLMAHPAAHHLNPSHQMFYPLPQTPTERSFMEFVRSYPAPSHMNYPRLNSLIPSASSLQTGLAAHGPAPPAPLQVPPSAPLTVPPNFTASAYGFDRWPRLAFEHQRAYNSIYQATNPLPERPYASYAGGRPPPFPAGLFPPPF